MNIYVGTEGVRYPCVLFQMGTHFRDRTKAKQSPQQQGKASVQADGLLFLILVQANSGEGFCGTSCAHFSTESIHRLQSVADRVHPVAEIQEVHKYMETNQHVGKIILELPQ